MEKIILLENRDRVIYTLSQLKSTTEKVSKTYKIVQQSAIHTQGYNEDGSQYIVFRGGPTLTENTFLKEANAKIKCIDYIYNYGYVLTFE